MHGPLQAGCPCDTRYAVVPSSPSAIAVCIQARTRSKSTHNHLRVLLGVTVLGDLDVDRGRGGLLLDRETGVRGSDLLGNGLGSLAARRGVDGGVSGSVRDVSGLGLLERRARGRDRAAGQLGSGRLNGRHRGKHASRVRRVQASNERGPVRQWSSHNSLKKLTCCPAGRGCGASAQP